MIHSAKCENFIHSLAFSEAMYKPDYKVRNLNNTMRYY
jgi:hypothetical protein